MKSMSPAMWESIVLCATIGLGGLFVIGLMIATILGDDEKRRSVRGGGFVE